MSFDEQLIELVREKKQLYDLTDLGYKNVHKKEKIWEEIGRKLNCSAEKCKKRWKGLRDTYKRSKRSLHLPSGSAPQEDTIRWKYYNHLTFLNDFEGYRRTIGSDNNFNNAPAEEYLECFSIDDPLEVSQSEYLILPAATAPTSAVATTSSVASTSAIAPTSARTSTAVASSSATTSTSGMRDKIPKKSPKTVNVQAASAELKELMSSVSQVMQTMHTNNAETDTELLFLSLARKVDTANLAILDKLELETEVIALVTNKIKQSIM